MVFVKLSLIIPEIFDFVSFILICWKNRAETNNLNDSFMDCTL